MTRSMQVLIGCGVGCGILLIVAMGACIGFVTWLQRPGELIEPGKLLDDATVAHAEWTLRTEDPGTERAVRDLLQALDRSRSAVPGLPQVFQDWSRKRDEQKLRQMFPMVVTWSLRRGTSDPLDQLFGISIPQLGNRIRIADWFLGFIAGRDEDIEEEDHLGEQIYRLPKNGAAFFIRSGAVFVATDVVQARSAVDALERSGRGAAPAALVELLDGLPPAPLRGAALNEAGACAAILRWLTDDPSDEVDLSSVRALTIAGGFTPGSAFEATLTVYSDDPRFGSDNAARLAERLAERLGIDVTPVDTDAVPLALRLSIDDPAGALEERFNREINRPRRARE